MLLEFSIAFLDGWIEGESEEVLRHWTRVKQAASTDEAARVLAEFAKTAPGRLPQRVQDALAVIDGVPGTPGGQAE